MFEKLCMTLLLIMVSINVGFLAFSAAMTETSEMLSHGSFVTFDYEEQFANISEAVKNLTDSVVSINPLGLIVYGLSTAASLLVFIFTSLLNMVTGYFTISVYFANLLEAITDPPGPIHILFGVVGLIMSGMASYGLFVMARSVLVR